MPPPTQAQKYFGLAPKPYESYFKPLPMHQYPALAVNSQIERQQHQNWLAQKQEEAQMRAMQQEEDAYNALAGLDYTSNPWQRVQDVQRQNPTGFASGRVQEFLQAQREANPGFISPAEEEAAYARQFKTPREQMRFRGFMEKGMNPGEAAGMAAFEKEQEDFMYEAVKEGLPAEALPYFVAGDGTFDRNGALSVAREVSDYRRNSQLSATERSELREARDAAMAILNDPSEDETAKAGARKELERAEAMLTTPEPAIFQMMRDGGARAAQQEPPPARAPAPAGDAVVDEKPQGYVARREAAAKARKEEPTTRAINEAWTGAKREFHDAVIAKLKNERFDGTPQEQLTEFAKAIKAKETVRGENVPLENGRAEGSPWGSAIPWGMPVAEWNVPLSAEIKSGRAFVEPGNRRTGSQDVSWDEVAQGWADEWLKNPSLPKDAPAQTEEIPVARKDKKSEGSPPAKSQPKTKSRMDKYFPE